MDSKKCICTQRMYASLKVYVPNVVTHQFVYVRENSTAEIIKAISISLFYQMAEMVCSFGICIHVNIFCIFKQSIDDATSLLLY